MANKEEMVNGDGNKGSGVGAGKGKKAPSPLLPASLLPSVLGKDKHGSASKNNNNNRSHIGKIDEGGDWVQQIDETMDVRAVHLRARYGYD